MNKENKYKTLLIAAKVLIYKDVDDIANMANISRLLMDHFPNHWIGFYRVQADKLILGPFQGPIACTSIGFGKGVCGVAWQTKQTQIVDDVHQYPGHIACSALSNSEIVVPCIRENSVYAVLDVDSTEFNAFDETDQRYLEELVTYL
ncbi:MAG: L-methionine (R)-S-oxide reductase [Bacteroidia bacterium]